MAGINDVVRAAEILRQSAGFSKAFYADVFEAFKKHHPELVPEEQPEPTERSIAIGADAVIRKRYTTPPPFPAIREEK